MWLINCKILRMLVWFVIAIYPKSFSAALRSISMWRLLYKTKDEKTTRQIVVFKFIQREAQKIAVKWAQYTDNKQQRSIYSGVVYFAFNATLLRPIKH